MLCFFLCSNIWILAYTEIAENPSDGEHGSGRELTPRM